MKRFLEKSSLSVENYLQFPSNERKLLSEDFFINFSKNFLQKVIFDLKLGVSDNKILQNSLKDWFLDDVHGLQHSYLVYKTAVGLAKKERAKCSIKKIFVLSIIHDLSEFLPLFDHNKKRVVRKVGNSFVSGGNLLNNKEISLEKRWKAENHPRLMAWLIRSVGSYIDIDQGDLSSLSKDILYHDKFWDKPSYLDVKKYSAVLSEEGKILHDADRLVMDPILSDSEVLYNNIKRTESYGLGREYFFRNLSVNNRLKWWKRSGGLFDTLMPLLVEFSSPSYMFLTKNGKKIYEKKQKLFMKSLLIFLEEKYEEEKKLATKFLEENGYLICGFKSHEEETFQLKGNQLSLISKEVFRRKVSFLSNKKNNYYGYSINVNGRWLDPSILKYKSFLLLKRDVLKAVNKYQKGR